MPGLDSIRKRVEAMRKNILCALVMIIALLPLVTACSGETTITETVTPPTMTITQPAVTVTPPTVTLPAQTVTTTQPAVTTTYTQPAETVTQPPVTVTETITSTITTTLPLPPEPPKWSIINFSYYFIEDTAAWFFHWHLTLKSEFKYDITLTAVFNYLDGEENIIYSTQVSALELNAGEIETFIGQAIIPVVLAKNVSKVEIVLEEM